MATDQLVGSDDRTLCGRIIAEYLEMPGLIVTIPQGSRLWHIEAPRCEQVLGSLFASGFLRKLGNAYLRANDGRESPRLGPPAP